MRSTVRTSMSQRVHTKLQFYPPYLAAINIDLLIAPPLNDCAVIYFRFAEIYPDWQNPIILLKC